MRLRKRLLPVCGMLVLSCLSNTGCQTTDNNNAVGGAVVGTGLALSPERSSAAPLAVATRRPVR